MDLKNIIKNLSQNGNSTGCFISGEFKELNAGNFIKEAIQSSADALNEWTNHPNRCAILAKASKAVVAKKNILLNVAQICDENVHDLENDISFCAQTFSYYSKLSNKVNLASLNLKSKGSLCAVILEDCRVFSTFSLIVTAPISAGNTIVLLANPSLSVILVCFAAILYEAGLPAGVLNIIPYVGEDSFPIISSHFSEVIGLVPEGIPSSDNFHFSNVIFRKKSMCPVIILKTADVDSAIDSIINYTESSESLWFPNIIYVEETSYEKFLQILKFVVKKRNANFDGQENNSEVDLILNKLIKEKNSRGVEIIELIHRTFNCIFLVNDNSALNLPVINDEKKTAHHRVISIMPIRTLQEAASQVNSSSGGLCVSVWSNDAVEILSLPFQLKYGTIWVNSANHYSPSVPFSPWDSFGHGTFLGKRAYFENLTTISSPIQAGNYYYPAERNSVFSKKDISSVTKQSIAAFASWSKLDYFSKTTFLENAVTFMDKNWSTHFKIILDKTDEQVWKKCIFYMKFWTSYSVDTVYHQSFQENGFQIISRAEPLGVIAILAGSTPLDELIFLITAGLVYGNAIVIGISSDEKCSIIGTELENLFNAKPGLVSVIVNNSKDLWSQLVSNADISAIWAVKSFVKFSLKNCSYKKIFEIGDLEDMTVTAERFEIYATKQKTVWLPSLC